MTAAGAFLLVLGAGLGVLLISLWVVWAIALRLHGGEDPARAQRLAVEYGPRQGTLERRARTR